MTKIDKWRDADGRTADPYAGLRAAIEAGPTDGPWVSCGPSFGADKPVYCEEVVVDRTHDEDDGYGICQAPTGLERESTVDMNYIAEANPAAIRTLLAERDQLATDAQNSANLVWALARELNCLPSTFSDANGHVLKAAIALNAERDSLAGEVARLNGEASVMRDLLRECHGVIRTIEAESSEESDLLATLVADVERAIVPNTGGEPHAHE